MTYGDKTGDLADGFELYDLRVEVVAPAGATIYCNSQPGDYFEVRGELLHFPQGKPFSMYQPGRHPAHVAGQAASNRRQRLDDDRLRGGLPGSELSDPLSHHAARQEAFQSRGNHRRTVAAAMTADSTPRASGRTRRTVDGLYDFAPAQGRLASRGRPRKGRARPGDRGHGGFRRSRHHDVRLC